MTTTPDPWSDERLSAAFTSYAGAAAPPADLVPTVRAVIDGPPAQRSGLPLTARAWRRLLAVTAVVVLAVGGVAGGLVVMGGPPGSGQVTFRDGPSPDLRTLDAGEFVFDFPAAWLAYDASTAFSGGSSIAVLGTQPVETRCGRESHVDINCVFEQPLGPGDIRVFVGTGAYRGGTVLDRTDIENGTTTRLTVGAMPAILDTFDVTADSYYGEDVSFAWSIGRPATLTNVVSIEVRARDPGAAEVKATLDALIASFRFSPPPTPLPSDPAAAEAAARAAIETESAAFRRGYVGDVDSTAETYLECLGDVPVDGSTASVQYGPGGDLGRPVDVSCSWRIGVETPTIWRLDLWFEWSVDSRSGRYTETLWLDVAASVLASTSAGDPPPAASAGPVGPTTVLELPVITVAEALDIRDAGIDDRELAVRGWFSPIPPVGCPAPATWPVTPVEPNCPDQWVVLMAEPEHLVTVEENGFSGGAISGPAFRIDLDDLDGSWQPRLPALGPAEPVEIVVVGHFDDRRSLLCPDAVKDDCRDRFVVDRVEWVDGTTQPFSMVGVDDGRQASTPEAIQAIVAAETPSDSLLSMAVVDGSTGIGRIEPSLGTGRGDFIDQAWVWVTRVLEAERAVSYLVVDGTDAIFEMNGDGIPVQVGGSPLPTAAPSPGAFATFRFNLVATEGSGVGMVVSDGSRWLIDARSATEEEFRGAGPGVEVGRLTVDQLGSNILLVRWAGGPCDSALTLDIAPGEPLHLSLRGDHKPCDAMGIGRGVVLTFNGDIRADQVTTEDLQRSVG